jgi:uncharacterized protein YuzE
MKLARDHDNNVAYFSLVEGDSIKVEMTVPVYTTGGQYNLDLDERGALLGIEFLNAETQLAALKEDLSVLPDLAPPIPIPPSQWPEGGK